MAVASEPSDVNLLIKVIDPPEKVAYGGVAGLLGERTNYRYGGDTMGGKNDKSKTSKGPDRSAVGPGSTYANNVSNRNDGPDYSGVKQIAKQTAINTAKNVGGKKLLGVLGLSQYANPIGQAMAVKALYDKFKNKGYAVSGNFKKSIERTINILKNSNNFTKN